MTNQFKSPLKIVGFVALVFICAAFLQIGLRVFSLLPDGSAFCSTEDKVYQTIAANAEEWVNNYPATGTPSFTIEAVMRSYSVVADWDGDVRQGKPSIIHISTGMDRRLNGSEGYIYSSDGSKPLGSIWQDYYWVKRLDEHIYCYKF